MLLLLGGNPSCFHRIYIYIYIYIYITPAGTPTIQSEPIAFLAHQISVFPDLRVTVFPVENFELVPLEEL